MERARIAIALREGHEDSVVANQQWQPHARHCIVRGMPDQRPRSIVDGVERRRQHILTDQSVDLLTSRVAIGLDHGGIDIDAGASAHRNAAQPHNVGLFAARRRHHQRFRHDRQAKGFPETRRDYRA